LRNLPADVQLLRPIKLAVVAFLEIAAQQASEAKSPEPLGDQGHLRYPKQVPCERGAEAAIPLLLLGMCWFAFQLSCLFQAQVSLSWCWKEGGGEGNIY